MSLAEMLRIIAELTGKKPPTDRDPTPRGLAFALGAEAVAHFTGREPFATRDGLKMAKKKMYFSSAKAASELAYRARPAREGLTDAIAWFRQAGYCPLSVATLIGTLALLVWAYLLLLHGGFWRTAAGARAAERRTRIRMLPSSCRRATRRSWWDFPCVAAGPDLPRPAHPHPGR